MKTTGASWLCALTFSMAACGGGGGGGPGATGVPESDTPTAVGNAGAVEAVPVNIPVGPGTASAYRRGDTIFLERRAGSEVTRIAVDTRRGGMIVEASLNGENFVNAHDAGRAVQLALYDGAGTYDACAGCGGTWGWNPVQGGDRADRGSAVLASSVATHGVTVRTRPLHWMAPGAGPVESDVLFEQRISPVEGDVRAYRVNFTIEYEGTQLRAVASQELPAAYAGAQYNRLVTYAGDAPWSNDPETAAPLAPLGPVAQQRYSAERWFALVDSRDAGLTIFAPGSSPWVSGFVAPGRAGPLGSGTAFARADTLVSFQPGRVVRGHYYLIVGDYRVARATVYRLRAAEGNVDHSAPRMALDVPRGGDGVSGMLGVQGWAYDQGRSPPVVRVYVDGQFVGEATHGIARGDVPRVFRDAPPASGYSLAIDMRAWGSGRHTIAVQAVDSSGNESWKQAEVSVIGE